MKPDISIIIPLYKQKSVEDCVDSLLRQNTSAKYEIIVVDSSPEAIFVKKHQNVRVIRLKERAFPGIARNIGISAAKADILAFIDADCVADEKWLQFILESHRLHDVVGGKIANGNSSRLSGWSIYLCEFGEFSGGKKRLLYSVPSCNISYKRIIFKKYGGFPETRTSEDTVFNARIREKVLFDPKMVVYHINRTDLPSIFDTCIKLGYGSASARRTALLPGSFLVDMPYLIPLLFPYRLLLIIGRAIRSNNVTMLLLSSPLIFLNLLAWNLGFFKGALEK
ncbi:MAG: glycosyltransferase [Candidatus Woesearchaeota archaeon]